MHSHTSRIICGCVKPRHRLLKLKFKTHSQLHAMSHPYTTPGFLRSSHSLASSSSDSVASIFTTTSSSTTPPGIGYLSGKFILGFGGAVLRGVESVAIRRRLWKIESLCPFSDSNPPQNVEGVCDDMLELARCVFLLDSFIVVLKIVGYRY